MSRFTTPKVFAPYEPVLASADLNAIASAVAGSLNNISNAQVSENAAIQGSKLADLAIGVGHFNADSIGRDAIAVNAMTRGVDSDEATGLNVLLNTVYAVIASVTLTTAGGPVLLLGAVAGYVDHTALSINAARFKLSRLSFGDLTKELESNSYGPGSDEYRPLCMGIFWVDGSLPAGTYTWRIEARQTSAVAITHVSSYQLFALELA